jgi:ribosomal protein L11 methyltransferase
MSWIKLIIDPCALPPERIETALEFLGAEAVSMEDAGDDPVLEPGVGETPTWRRTRVIGLFPASTDAGALGEDLARLFPKGVAPVHRFEILEDRDWSLAWAEHATSMCFGRRLWVVPGDRAPSTGDDAVIVRIPPGLAFGTGTHPTTAMCLEWLDGHPPRGLRVLDFGCGSGILAIAAARLGATTVVAVDNDPQALQSTRINAEANGIGDRVRTCTPEALDEDRFDLVLANILANPLIDLAPRLSARIAPGGHIVLSGILAEQAGSVLAAYAGPLRFEAPLRRDNWIRLHGSRIPAGQKK